MDKHYSANDQAHRFSFGQNWSNFLGTLDPLSISMAEESLSTMFAPGKLEGKYFIDVGAGSGLFSLIARRLGARVYSFDYDQDSVKCVQHLRDKFFPEDSDWQVARGSILDGTFLETLGKADIVYAWGVLHHTGAMWVALANAAALVKPGGYLMIAIYNDQGRASRIWTTIKLAYNRLPPWLKWLLLGPCFLFLWTPAMVRDLLIGKPFRTWALYKGTRGMSPWHDVIDWVGGYPFEVATPEQVFEFYRDRGFELRKLKTCGGGHGCNEFVFASGPFTGPNSMNF